MDFERKKLSELMGMKSPGGRWGIEVELEGRGAAGRMPEGWVPHQEGSLRNGGIEYVLPRPLDFGRELDSALASLHDTLTREGVTLDYESYRTSTHIHINMVDETIETILRFITLYTVIDPFLVSVVGRYRDGNVFCMNMSDTGEIHLGIEQFIKAAKTGNATGVIVRGKYASLNMSALWRFGSLECRVFPMSVYPVEITKWLGWLWSILQHAKGRRPLLDYINEAISRPEVLRIATFGDTTHPKGDELIRQGAFQAYEAWAVIQEEIAKEGRKKNKVEAKLDTVQTAQWVEAPAQMLNIPDIQEAMRMWAPAQQQAPAQLNRVDFDRAAQGLRAAQPANPPRRRRNPQP